MNDLKCKLGLNVYANIVIVIFKEMPDKLLTEELRRTGFTVSELPPESLCLIDGIHIAHFLWNDSIGKKNSTFRHYSS
jgi:hypothetical protein